MRYIDAMSAVLPKTPKASPSRPKAPDPAAANAAAASFAVLEAQLGYLSEAEKDMVLKAYKYADEAHLGQMRKSGEPYITHPIAVAGLCTEWKLDAQALAQALVLVDISAEFTGLAFDTDRRLASGQRHDIEFMHILVGEQHVHAPSAREGQFLVLQGFQQLQQRIPLQPGTCKKLAYLGRWLQ